ncbi:glyoxalase superfamily protein [Flexibacterium corallicola]|uniref:glyoxalase superfamily protein n=1 Tax=Flexibacterium corallicola TaxID=3037259 RepID=UPI00286F2CB6|nr:glyoxalase superfamily protein [Pseudovibrio sp. M1P-2-3]
MDQPYTFPSVQELKEQAKRLRAELQDRGVRLGHSQSLEILSKQLGFKNWNTLHAKAGNGSRPIAVGARVRGTYLKQPFEAEVIGLHGAQDSQMRRITLQLIEPVDVSAFESMKILRSRISVLINSRGQTGEKTSDGEPHLRLDL